jgi:hypothetical protein
VLLLIAMQRSACSPDVSSLQVVKSTQSKHVKHKSQVAAQPGMPAMQAGS